MAARIEVLTHSSIRISGSMGVVYADPFQVKGEPHDADYILATHDHFDHFSPDDIRKISKEGTILVIPEAMLDKAQEAADMVQEICCVFPWSRQKIQGLDVEAVPSYNIGKPFHPKEAGWVGYILTIDGERIYIAGDTDVNEDNLKVRCDTALVPVGGKYTMDAAQAAELINEIRPSVAIPTHYGSVAGKKKDAETFRKLVREPVKVEIIMQY